MSSAKQIFNRTVVISASAILAIGAFASPANAIPSNSERMEHCKKNNCSTWEQIYNDEILGVMSGMKCGATVVNPTQWGNLHDDCVAPLQ